MKNSVSELLPRVSRDLLDISSSNLPMAEKTYLERMTMQGQASESWTEADQRKFVRIATAFLNDK